MAPDIYFLFLHITSFSCKSKVQKSAQSICSCSKWKKASQVIFSSCSFSFFLFLKSTLSFVKLCGVFICYHSYTFSYTPFSYVFHSCINLLNTIDFCLILQIRQYHIFSSYYFWASGPVSHFSFISVHSHMDMMQPENQIQSWQILVTYFMSNKRVLEVKLRGLFLSYETEFQ